MIILQATSLLLTAVTLHYAFVSALPTSTPVSRSPVPSTSSCQRTEVACIIDGKQACCPENEIPLAQLSPVGGGDGEGEEGSDSQSDCDGITQRHESKPERKVCRAGEKGKLYRPEMKTMVNGQLVTNVGDNLALSKKDSSRQDQQMTFRPPEGAKGCAINWSVAAARSFSVKGNGYAKLTPVGSKDGVGAADFTNWPQVIGMQDHVVVPRQDCKEEMQYTVALQEDGEVSLKQSKDNGFYMEYIC
ncbi:hypothetical protein PABG_06037 [Paracoccidioides brasiliensis Pb03]|nr:hypothetical protein PABG_06037 [Paracoccidioides brasiliensis Pb03]